MILTISDEVLLRITVVGKCGCKLSIPIAQSKHGWLNEDYCHFLCWCVFHFLLIGTCSPANPLRDLQLLYSQSGLNISFLIGHSTIGFLSQPTHSKVEKWRLAKHPQLWYSTLHLYLQAYSLVLTHVGLYHVLISIYSNIWT